MRRKSTVSRQRLRRLISEGDAARDRSDWPEAARLYGLVVEGNPSMYHIRVQLGHAYKELGDFDNAALAYQVVLQRTPFDDDVHLQIAHLEKLKGNTREAAAAYRKSAELNPGNTDAVTEYAALAPKLGLPPLPSSSFANQERLGQANAARLANGNASTFPLLGPVLSRLSERIAPLVRGELSASLVAELERHFKGHLLPELRGRIEAVLAQELPKRVETIVTQELPGQVETILAQELPKRVETILAQELPKRVETILAQELPERVKAIIDSLLAAKQSEFYRPNFNIVGGTVAGPYMAASNALASDFFHPEYREFCRISHTPVVLHRKWWEWAFIYERLCRMGIVCPGMRGLGFGVGGEKLPSLLARLGAHITASDAPIGQNWFHSSALSDHQTRLFYSNIIDRESFDNLVSFEYCDMNNIPNHLNEYDFCWSSCSFEHLGSLQHGIDFVINSIERSLKIGGVACHTTELNLSSNDATIETGGTVIYRKRDLERLCQILEERGHWVEPLRIEPGTLPPDYFVDVPPYPSNPHLKLLYGSYVVTSVGLVARRGR